MKVFAGSISIRAASFKALTIDFQSRLQEKISKVPEQYRFWNQDYSYIDTLSFSEIASRIQVLNSQVVNLASRFTKKISTHTASIVKTSAEKVNLVSSKIVSQLGSYSGYVIGPCISLVGAALVRMSFGKRAPTSGPLMFSVFVATTALVTIWAIQFFKHPKYQKIVQNKGVKHAFQEAIPLLKPSIIEPLHTRHFVSCDKLEGFLKKPEIFSCEPVGEQEAKSSFRVFKQYCDWVKRNKLDRSSPEVMKILKKTLSQNLIKVLKGLVSYGNKALIEEFLAFNAKDTFVSSILTKAEFQDIYFQFGIRLAALLKKSDLVNVFPQEGSCDLNIAVVDALISQNSDKVVDLTTTGEIDPYKVFIYGNDEDVLMANLGFSLPPMNLIQICILSGDVESLKRIISSSTQECNWKQKDSNGLSLLNLAAVSGSKAMWDFVKQFFKTFPHVDHIDFLHLLYAAIKGGCLGVFEELFNEVLDEEYKDLSGALFLDVYQKAVSFKASDICTYLESHTQLTTQLSKTTSVSPMLQAAILGSNEVIFDRFFEQWKSQGLDNPLAMKEIYETLLKAKTPADAILMKIRAFENSFSAAYQFVEIDVSRKGLVESAKCLSEDSLIHVLGRIPNEQILRHISEKGAFFTQILNMPKALTLILDKCTEAKHLTAVFAKEAIKLCKLDALRILCEKGIDVVKKLPDSNESLLSYSMLSLNPDLVNILLGHSRPLSQVLIAQLKVRVGEIKSSKEDDIAHDHIVRLLDAKSFERGSVQLEDPNIHLALVKAGAMEFSFETAEAPKEDVSRGLLATGLSILGLL
jgi:hypothetical protein